MHVDCVVFLTEGRGYGLTFINTELAIYLSKNVPKGCEFIVVVSKNEQHTGLRNRLISELNCQRSRVVQIEEWKMFPNYIEDLLRSGKSVLCQCQGVRDVLDLWKVKVRFKSKLLIAGITHSYRHHKSILGRKIVSLLHCLIYRYLGEFLIFQCDSVSRDFFGGKWLRTNSRAKVIPLGCSNEDYLVPDRDDLSVQDIYRMQEKGEKYFVYLARFAKVKNHKKIIRFIKEGNFDSKVKFLFLGFGPLLEECRELVKDLNLEDQIFLPGRIHRDYVPWALKGARAAIVASSNETFGHCYLEPMALGVPVLGTSEGVARSLLFDYFTGLGFSLKNSDSFVRGIEFYLKCDKVTLEEIGLRSKVVASSFTWENVSKSYWCAYNSWSLMIKGRG